MVEFGAFGFGVVLGWTAGFIGWSLSGVSARALALMTVAISLTFLAAEQLVLGVAGTVAGILGHETLLAAVIRRAS